MFYIIYILTIIILAELSNADPAFVGQNPTHQAIIAKDIKTESIGPFKMMPIGEHSVVFSFDDKKFAKITVDENNFSLAINPSDVPAKYKQVKRIDGNFEANINDDKDLNIGNKK